MLTTLRKALPFHLPLIGEEEIEAVTEVLRSGWLTTGPKVRQFEEEFSQYIGGKHSIAVNSCTAALHLALEASGVKDGDEVILPTLTFAATAEVVLYLRARPVLVDSVPGTLNMDPAAVLRAITPKTKAIIPVHFGGHPCDMQPLLDTRSKYGIKLIEDAAHALPAWSEAGMVGTTGDITCFSFYSTKTLTTGEGGMAVTDDDQLADRMRIMSLHGISKDAWKRYSATGTWRYEILEAGFKYNLTDIQAALGLVQLNKCDSMRDRRAVIAARYREAFESLETVELLNVESSVQHAWHLFVILIQPDMLSISRDTFINELRERNIGTSVHFIPLHLHPLYQNRFGYRPGQFAVAEHYFERCISLPLYPGMSDEDVDFVIESVFEIAANFRR